MWGSREAGEEEGTYQGMRDTSEVEMSDQREVDNKNRRTLLRVKSSDIHLSPPYRDDLRVTEGEIRHQRKLHLQDRGEGGEEGGCQA